MQHWHADADGRVTESWSLGVFSGESVDAEVAQGAPGKRVLEKKDLLARKKMEGRVWPYIAQMYTGGDRYGMVGREVEDPGMVGVSQAGCCKEALSVCRSLSKRMLLQ